MSNFTDILCLSEVYHFKFNRRKNVYIERLFWLETRIEFRTKILGNIYATPVSDIINIILGLYLIQK